MVQLIGVTVGRVPVARRTMDAADSEYCRAVHRAGGDPVMLPALPPSDPAALVRRLDGLLLTGGGDVVPAAYGAAASPHTAGTDAERDRTEIALALAALESGLPVLGICRGFQILNVALGGTLFQHLPERSRIPHLEPLPRHKLVHDVVIDARSRLHEVTGCDQIQVNSIHHQGIDRLATALRAVAWAADGLVEAVEHRDLPVLAVQWHPESLVGQVPQEALFDWLVKASCLSPSDR